MRLHNKLSEEERDYLSEMVESSLRVVNKHQFFVWSQGPLQRLLPHEILICGVDDGARRGFEHYHFEATRYFREHHFEALCHSEDGLLRHLVQISERNGSALYIDMNEAPPPPAEAALRKLIDDNELKNLAAALWYGPRGKLQAFYAFSRVVPLTERTAYLLELALPCVHVTFMRVLASQESTGTSGARAGRLITARQKEILALIRDGKTNGEIAVILEVSPWTIKSHMQMIFQRLNTTNRTQAITRAISLGILRAE